MLKSFVDDISCWWQFSKFRSWIFINTFITYTSLIFCLILLISQFLIKCLYCLSVFRIILIYFSVHGIVFFVIKVIIPTLLTCSKSKLSCAITHWHGLRLSAKFLGITIRINYHRITRLIFIFIVFLFLLPIFSLLWHLFTIKNNVTIFICLCADLSHSIKYNNKIVK